MLKLRGTSHSSTILRSDSTQSNNRKGNSIHPPVRDLMSNTRLFRATTAYTMYTCACTDARAALAPQLSGGARVRHWQSARRLWPDTWRMQLPLDDCYRLVFSYHASHHATDRTVPQWPSLDGTMKGYLLALQGSIRCWNGVHQG